MKLAVPCLAVFVAGSTVAVAGTATPDDCRAEFQANLLLQGGYAPEAVARAGKPGTAEAIYNACLAGLRGNGQGDYASRLAARPEAGPREARYRRGPQPACGVTFVAGSGYACHATRFGG
ncbi:MAG: hypothetical protein ACK5M4_13215 [Pseudorhodobacter sp.]